MRNELNLSE